MKKVICFLLVLCIAIVAVACGRGQSTESAPIKLSAQMFDNAYIELDNAENIGLIGEESVDPESKETTIDRTYLVSIREDGSFEKITFVFTKTDKYGDGTYEVTQENIEPQPVNLCVTDTFIFVAYSNYSLYVDQFEDPEYNKRFSRGDENFAIARATGKLYSLSEIGDFSIVSDNIVSTWDESHRKIYYYLHVEDGALVVTDLLPNKNIFVSDACEDGFGNIYVKNDSISRKEGNIVYVTERVLVGDDGYAYYFRGDVYADPEEDLWGKNLYTVKRYGQDGVLQEENWTPGETFVGFEGKGHYRDEYGYVAFLGNEMYAINADGTGGKYCWYGTLTKGDANTYLAKALLPNMQKVYPLSPRILVAETYGEIWFYDLSSEKIMGGSFSKPRFEAFGNQGLLLSGASLYKKNGTAYARVEDVSGTSVYRFELIKGENGLPSVKAVLCQEIGYDATVLILQPLN